MMMLPDMSVYPATKQGAEQLSEALMPAILHLWKAKRDLIGDDVVAMVDASTNQTSLYTRSSVLSGFKQKSPDAGIVFRLSNPPEAKPGAVVIWTIIRFPKGRLCILPLVIARS